MDVAADDKAIAANQTERELIAALVSGKLPADSLNSIFERVQSEDITDGDFRFVFELSRDAHEMGLTIRPALIETELRKTGKLIHLGGSDGFAIIARDGKTVWRNALYYADQIAEAALGSRLESLLTEAKNSLHAGEPIADTASRLEADLRGLSVRSYEDGFVTAGEAASQSIAAIEASIQSGELSGVQTGLRGLDDDTGGLQPGSMTVLAARPSVGKSCVGAEIAQRVAERGESVMFCSLEMSAKEMGDRFLSRLTGIPSDYIRDPRELDADQLQRLRNAQQRLAAYPLRLWGTTGVSIGKLKASARLCKARHGLSLLVVDYIGLVGGSGKDIRERVANVSLELKGIAGELSVPVLALCQLNRESEKPDRSGKTVIRRPTLAELRDSGSIEQDADNVWFVVRDRDSEDCTIAIAKFRNGRVGDVSLKFDGAHSRVDDVPLGQPFRF